MFILLISSLSITVPGCNSSGDSDGDSSESSGGGSSSWVGKCIVQGDTDYSHITYYNIDYSENCTQNGAGTWSNDVSDTSCAGTNMACQRTSPALNFKYCQCWNSIGYNEETVEGYCVTDPNTTQNIASDCNLY